jgi:hypothetical protein
VAAPTALVFPSKQLARDELHLQVTVAGLGVIVAPQSA